MGRIISIDPGKKRTGLAVTDPLQIIATGLTTVNTSDLSVFLKKYTAENEVDTFVVGYPKNLDNTYTDSTEMVNHLVSRLKREHPAITCIKVDERFTSKMAKQAMFAGGLKKKDRQNKKTIDMISATIILQSYLDQRI